MPSKRKPAAGYPLAAVDATEAPLGPHLRRLLGERFLATPAGHQLRARRGDWLGAIEAWLDRLLEFVPEDRLRRVFRPALRSDRQVVAAGHEILTGFLLADLARRLDFDVAVGGGRRADLRVDFLSGCFHVEVKTHEERGNRPRPAGWRMTRSLADAARRQASHDSPNLLVLGRVRADAVRRLVRSEPAGSVWSAVARLQVIASRGRVQWRGALHAVPEARHPFAPPFRQLLRSHWEGG